MSKRIYQYARPIVLCPNHLDEDMLEDCLFCRIAELQAKLAQLEEDYRLLKALYKQEAHS